MPIGYGHLAGFYVVATAMFYVAGHLANLYCRVDPNRRVRDHWFRPSEIIDLHRYSALDDARGRFVLSFPRQLVALLINYVLVCVSIALSWWHAETGFVLFAATALVCPFTMVYAAYGSLPLRVIPLCWGMMIGATTTVMAASLCHPWGWQPAELFDRLWGSHPDALARWGVVMTPFLVGSIAFVALANPRPTNWCVVCLLRLLWASIVMGVGLMMVKLL